MLRQVAADVAGTAAYFEDFMGAVEGCVDDFLGHELEEGVGLVFELCELGSAAGKFFRMAFFSDFLTRFLEGCILCDCDPYLVIGTFRQYVES